MCTKQLFAEPVREGLIEISGETQVVWRDYRWNTGQVIRWWFMKAEETLDSEILIRPIAMKSKDRQDQ
jgi:hypothetical protein